MKECSFVPKIMKRMPQTTKNKPQIMISKVDPQLVESVFDHNWTKYFRQEKHCKPGECRWFIKMCIDEVKAGAWDEESY